jgi:hypothetical protein
MVRDGMETIFMENDFPDSPRFLKRISTTQYTILYGFLYSQTAGQLGPSYFILWNGGMRNEEEMARNVPMCHSLLGICSVDFIYPSATCFTDLLLDAHNILKPPVISAGLRSRRTSSP